MNKWIKIPEKNGDSDFLRLFKHKEFIQLAGVGSDKILKLAAIIFFTLLTLCYALGSLDKLKERMDNPYTNWVDMPLSRTGDNSYDSLYALQRYFQDVNQKKRFDLDNITGYVASDAKFIHATELHKIFPHKGRTIEPGEKLLSAILESKNVLRTMPMADSVFNSDKACGIIITRASLEGLGYSDWKSVEKIALKFYDDYIYIDVLGVVKDLPDYCDFICTPRFYNLLLNGSIRPHETGVVNEDTTNIMVVTALNGDTKKMTAYAQEHLTDKGFKVLTIKQHPVKLNSAVSHYQYEIIFNHANKPDEMARKSFFDASNNTIMPSTNWFCIDTKYDVLSRPYWLAFNFNDLGEVREFKSFMASRFRMNINLAQVEAKDNFKKVTQITFVVCATLFIFGILSIVLFITNLLRTHLEGIRSNLGTLKAFGLKDGWLQNTYNIIISYFLAFAFTIALIPLIIIVVSSKLILEKPPFDLFNGYILASILVIFAVSLYFARKTAGDLVQATPGDLIYGR